MRRIYILSNEGVTQADVAYVVPGLINRLTFDEPGTVVVNPDGTEVVPSNHPSFPREQGDDWWGRFPKGGV